MSVLERPRTEAVALAGAAPPALPPGTWSEHEVNRWALVLGTPFLLGASSFGLAIALDANWPMIPAFFLGPFLLIAAYVFLMLGSDANSDT
jgi:hypothetical protein